MGNDAVATALELLIEEITNHLDCLYKQSEQYARAGNIDQATAQFNSIKAMQEFQVKIAALRDEWQRGLKTGVKLPHIPSARTGLVVKFPNGKVIKESTATETFARAIKEFGIDKVESLGKVANNWPLVSSKKYPNSTYTQQQIDNVFIMAPSSNRDKKRLLEDIAKELTIDIDVSITFRA